MKINGLTLTNSIDKLCSRDRNKLIKLIEEDCIDSCTRRVRLQDKKEVILQIDVFWDLMEIDLNYEDLELYLIDQDMEKKTEVLLLGKF